jgi:GNAT superfamily N-acetyltransferase
MSDVTPPSSPADTVRLASMLDCERIGEITVAAWRDRLGGILPNEILSGLNAPDLGMVWAGALINPPTPAHRLLVAVTSDSVIGYAAIGPSSDPDADARTAELLALEVDPLHQRAGHGSRLMTAAVDLSRQAGFEEMSAWCPVADEVRRAFLQSAGWAPDSAIRDLEVPRHPEEDDAVLREARLVTDIRTSA